MGLLMRFVHFGIGIYLMCIPLAFIVFLMALCARAARNSWGLKFTLGSSKWMKIPTTIIVALVMAISWPYMIAFTVVEIIENR